MATSRPEKHVKAPAVSAVPAPKHVLVREALREETRTLTPGAAIASERALMTRFEVSRATVRQAINALVDDGLLVRVPARGTFVARQRVESRLHLASFSDDMRSRGLVPSTRVVSVEHELASTHCPGTFPSAFVWRIERVRFADDEPIAHEISYFDASLTPELGRADLTGSLYALLRARYRLTLDSAEQTATAKAATERQVRLLGCPPHTPLLYFNRLGAAGERVVERTHSWYRADRYAITMHLTTDAATTASDRVPPTHLTPIQSVAAARGDTVNEEM